MNLLLATLLLLQEKTAEETFKQIETVIAEAKTINIRSTMKNVIDEKGGVHERSAQGLMLLKGERLVMVQLQSTSPDAPSKMSMTCDGTQISVHAPSQNEVFQPPNDLNLRIKKAITRVGMIGSMTESMRMILTGGIKKEPASEIEKLIEVTNVGWEPNEGDLKVLFYSVRIPGETNPMHVKLSYDPKDLRLINRNFSLKSASYRGEGVETYEEFTLNTEISDEQFKLPEGKK